MNVYKDCSITYQLEDNNFWIVYSNGEKAWDTPYKTYKGASKLLQWLQE